VIRDLVAVLGRDLVLQALARMRATGRDVVFHVAGTGPARAELEARAGELGLEDLVHFHGFVSEERKVELYRRSWVHVLTSVKEGWGISNIEAAGCGTPTVASDAPGVRESVVPGETGLLVPHGDVPALATAIADLLDDPERLRTLSEGARAYARGFSWDATARGVERVLRRVVAGSEAG